MTEEARSVYIYDLDSKIVSTTDIHDWLSQTSANAVQSVSVRFDSTRKQTCFRVVLASVELANAVLNHLDGQVFKSGPCRIISTVYEKAVATTLAETASGGKRAAPMVMSTETKSSAGASSSAEAKEAIVSELLPHNHVVHAHYQLMPQLVGWADTNLGAKSKESQAAGARGGEEGAKDLRAKIVALAALQARLVELTLTREQMVKEDEVARAEEEEERERERAEAAATAAAALAAGRVKADGDADGDNAAAKQDGQAGTTGASSNSRYTPSSLLYAGQKASEGEGGSQMIATTAPPQPQQSARTDNNNNTTNHNNIIAAEREAMRVEAFGRTIEVRNIGGPAVPDASRLLSLIMRVVGPVSSATVRPSANPSGGGGYGYGYGYGSGVGGLSLFIEMTFAEDAEALCRILSVPGLKKTSGVSSVSGAGGAGAKGKAANAPSSTTLPHMRTCLATASIPQFAGVEEEIAGSTSVVTADAGTLLLRLLGLSKTGGGGVVASSSASLGKSSTATGIAEAGEDGDELPPAGLYCERLSLLQGMGPFVRPPNGALHSVIGRALNERVWARSTALTRSKAQSSGSSRPPTTTTPSAGPTLLPPTDLITEMCEMLNF